MPYQINPSKVPIWQTETTLKLGNSADDQVLDSVTNSQERLIQLLFRGIAEDQLDTVANSVGLEAFEASELIDRLRPSLLEKPSLNTSATTFNARFAEIIRIGFESNQAPENILSVRSESEILLSSLDRTGLLLARALAEAGFRKLATSDFDMVSRHDVGELGYQAHQLGVARLSAAREVLAQHSSSISITQNPNKPKASPKLITFSGMHRLNPQLYRNLRDPHLVIEYGIDELLLSGVIQPGITACLVCRERWSSEENQNWASTAIQLNARFDELDDSAGLLLATALATKIICAFIDSGGQRSGGGYRVNLKTRAISELTWQPHPGCDCRVSTRSRNRDLA